MTIKRSWSKPALVVLGRAEAQETLIVACKLCCTPGQMSTGPGTIHDGCRTQDPQCGMNCATIVTS